LRAEVAFAALAGIYRILALAERATTRASNVTPDRWLEDGKADELTFDVLCIVPAIRRAA